MNESTWIIGSEPNIRLLGRHAADTVPFRPYWTGSGVELMLQCRRLAVELELPQLDSWQTVWMLVSVDHAPVARFALTPGRNWYTVLEGMDPAVSHRVSIVRETQPIADGFTTELLMHNLRSDGTLLPLPQPKMTVEFIGDSLTSGEGIVGPQGAMEWQTIWLSSFNYSHLVCQALDAQKRIISQSGWGVFSSWDNDPSCVLSRIYDAVCALGDADPTPYDFSREKADLVVINLGTNDSGAIAQLEEAAQGQRRRDIHRSAQQLLLQVRRNNPDAWILWVYGMCGDPLSDLFRSAVADRQSQGDPRVGYLTLDICTAEEQGSRIHPGILNHQAAAQKIVQWVRENTTLVEP